MAERALEGLRVVDISQGIAGPYATKLLADSGATVTKVEPPDGDSRGGWGRSPVTCPTICCTATRTSRQSRGGRSSKASRTRCGCTRCVARSS